MVALGNIFNTILKKKDYRDPKDVDYLLEICKKFPEFDLPHILLLNYQPDIFNQEVWKKGEDLRNQYNFNLHHYFETPKTESFVENSNSTKPDNLNIIDQKTILEAFLNKPKPKFI